jgi:hypothetical protein
MNYPFTNPRYLYYPYPMPKDAKSTPTIADLYPGLTPEEQRRAQESIDRYLQVVLRIARRLENDRKALADDNAAEGGR